MRPEHQLHYGGEGGGEEPKRKSGRSEKGEAYYKAVATGIFECVGFLVGLLAAAARLGDLALDQLKQAH